MKGTVKSKTDMERLFREGRRSSSYMLSVLTLPSEENSPQGRCAFVAGKKLGSAPFRSRCKRVMRQASTELGAPWEGHDVVFIAKHKIAHVPHEKLLKDMEKQLFRLKVVNDG